MLKSLIITGTPDGLNGVKGVNERMESVPYEKFPFCCSSSRANSAEKEFNMSKSYIAPIKRDLKEQKKLKSYQVKQEKRKVDTIVNSNTVNDIKEFPVDPNDFWSAKNIQRYMTSKHAHTPFPKSPYGPYKNARATEQ